MPSVRGVRWPRVRVLGNGLPIAGVSAVDVLSTGYFSADRFWLTAALGADPFGLRDLARQDEILVEIAISMSGAAGFTPLIRGEADGLEVDPIAGTLRIEGRDLSARLIEARTHDAFSNRTASEIAMELAGRHGLEADVQATATPVGRYWQLQHDRILLDQFGQATTEWDLLVTLAQFEGFDLWVGGATLHFRPADGEARAIRLGPQDVTGMQLERALTLARDVSVTVKSWNSRQQDAFTQTARRGGRGSRLAKARDYVVVVPNLSQADALKLAQARLAELSRHERVVGLEMPGELGIMPRSRVLLAGTGTDFDQSYVVDRVERHLSPTGGFTQRVRMRNADETGPADAAKGEDGWTGF